MFALITTLCLGIFFLAGMLIVGLSKHHIVEQVSISVAAGAMVALSVFDLIPEVFESFKLSGIWLALIFVVLGILALKGLDMLIPAHRHGHDHIEHPHHQIQIKSVEQPMGQSHHHSQGLIHIGIMSAIAIILHNVLEGMTVYSIADANITTGISLGIGVGLHNIPMGMLIFSTLKSENGARKYIILTLSVISTFIGGLLMMFVSPFLNETVLSCLVCITLGMVIYIVVFELIPSIIRTPKKPVSVICMLVGFFLVFFSAFLE